MRTVTGLIGRLKRLDKYAVTTPTATIGIRGTHYVLRQCNDDCFETEASGSASLEPVQIAAAEGADIGPLAQASGASGVKAPNGTYGGVTDGRIGVSNDTGEREFSRDQFFFVANRAPSARDFIFSQQIRGCTAPKPPTMARSSIKTWPAKVPLLASVI